MASDNFDRDDHYARNAKDFVELRKARPAVAKCFDEILKRIEENPYLRQISDGVNVNHRFGGNDVRDLLSRNFLNCIHTPAEHKTIAQIASSFQRRLKQELQKDPTIADHVRVLNPDNSAILPGLVRDYAERLAAAVTREVQNAYDEIYMSKSPKPPNKIWEEDLVTPLNFMFSYEQVIREYEQRKAMEKAHEYAKQEYIRSVETTRWLAYGALFSGNMAATVSFNDPTVLGAVAVATLSTAAWYGASRLSKEWPKQSDANVQDRQKDLLKIKEELSRLAFKKTILGPDDMDHLEREAEELVEQARETYRAYERAKIRKALNASAALLFNVVVMTGTHYEASQLFIEDPVAEPTEQEETTISMLETGQSAPYITGPNGEAYETPRVEL